jgi:hypothetical protein
VDGFIYYSYNGNYMSHLLQSLTVHLICKYRGFCSGLSKLCFLESVSFTFSDPVASIYLLLSTGCVPLEVERATTEAASKLPGNESVSTPNIGVAC